MSTRLMANTAGMSQSAISRIWRAFGRKPYLIETWKLSADPQFTRRSGSVLLFYRPAFAPPQP